MSGTAHLERRSRAPRGIREDRFRSGSGAGRGGRVAFRTAGEPSANADMAAVQAGGMDVDREVGDGDVLEFGGVAVVVAVPGHTDGSIALHLPGPRVLFTGATVANVGRAMPGVFHTDRARADQPLHRLAELEVGMAVFGHADPVSHGAAATPRSSRHDGMTRVGPSVGRRGGSIPPGDRATFRSEPAIRVSVLHAGARAADRGPSRL
ncbi:MBL fold metallo-hydrolase [Streptomyces sp. NPDC005423]|uniref:MBL fold metallo-hydrolase n=1 Tax=Streptomyces sp. NPDC005423 TaxID=3155343 RepID=UPI0033BE546A